MKNAKKLLKLPESRKHITHYLTSPDHFERKKYEETLPVTKTVKVRRVTHNARTSDRQKLRHKMYAIEITLSNKLKLSIMNNISTNRSKF